MTKQEFLNYVKQTKQMCDIALSPGNSLLDYEEFCAFDSKFTALLEANMASVRAVRDYIDTKIETKKEGK